MADEVLASPLPISYAPLLPWHRRRRVRRIIYAILLITLIVGGYFKGPSLWRQAIVMYSLRACLAHSEAPTTIVYDSAKKVKSLPLEWTRIESTVLPRKLPIDAVVFMHGMKSQRGNERLVVLTILQPGLLAGFVFDLGSWHELPKRKTGSAMASRLNTSVTEKIYAGQLDPKDPSRFVFRVDSSDGDVKLYEGRLNDHDGVDLTDHDLLPPRNPESPFRLAPIRPHPLEPL